MFKEITPEVFVWTAEAWLIIGATVAIAYFIRHLIRTIWPPKTAEERIQETIARMREEEE